jgi:uncharacterized protein (TIGR03382 family)
MKRSRFSGVELASRFNCVSVVFALVASGIILSGAQARADTFDFSFAGTMYNVTVTVEGQVMLPAVQGAYSGSASDLWVFGPVGMNPPFFPNNAPALTTYMNTVDATDWTSQIFNEFTETNGQITAFDFQACGQTPKLLLGSVCFALTETGSELVVGFPDPTIIEFFDDATTPAENADITFSSVPEPCPVSLVMSGLGGLAWLVRRRVVRAR